MKSKKLQRGLILSSFIFLLAGCGNSQTGQKGLWDHAIDHLSEFIKYLSHLAGDNYALGIILFTIITRIILLPIMQYQYKATRKTAELQPEIKKLREKYSARDRQTQLELQQAMKELNEKHGVNQLAGCLPALIQMPIMIALYQAILTTKELQTGHFLWAELGKVDPYFILPALAAFFTWLNGYLTLQGQTKDAQQLKFMQLYMLPAMIFFFGFSLNAALSLYWVVGNIFAVGQTLLLNNPYKLRREREQKLKEEKAKARALKKAMLKATKK
ncbi:membrane protein insertase YidC [Granulicatella sp. zg-84]|uniref:membrane protein insertase YidC n=1 Tax=unclassified Granulicatella TaxID=2630493 RepID=UPI0031F62480